MKKLQRALYYELQYRNAIVSDSLSFFDINLTKDSIENDFFVKDSSGMPVSCLESVGMSIPCKFSDFLERWYDLQIPDKRKKDYPEFCSTRYNLLAAFEEGRRECTIEYWTKDIFSNEIFINQKFYLTQNEEGEICALAVVKDFSEHKKTERESYKKELEQFAYEDLVTGGYNYNKFKLELGKLGLPGSIISIDIHSFKIINSICGVVTGDMVLKTVWECLMHVIDLKNNDITAHINADHFILFTPTEDQKKIIEKIKNISLALSLISVELDVPQVLPYFGIAKWSPEKRIELAYSEAVAAKHNARENQEQNYSFFDEQDTKRLIEEKKMADSFADALQRKDFKIWYQPKYNPVTKKLVGAEALVRWHKEDGSVVSPGVFIPLFERNGMIRVLDEYVFKTVCQQQKIWTELGKKIVPISINLSRASLYYKTVVNQYKLIAEDYGIDKSFIPIEITESAAVNNNTIQDVADQFYENGFRLHMDDFGSGYSSLASLNTMHFDTLKLDKSLIDYIGNFGGDRLLEHTINLAKELGMHVTAEGVESATQVTFLKHTGCDSIQGYFYSKPIPLEEFEEKLENINSTSSAEPIDYLAQHIAKFKQDLVKTALYSFTVNITKDTFEENLGGWDWHRETQTDSLGFSESVQFLADNFITPEYKQAYLDFMNREKMLSKTNCSEHTSFFHYTRSLNGRVSCMRLMKHLFKISGSDDLWAYVTVTEV